MPGDIYSPKNLNVLLNTKLFREIHDTMLGKQNKINVQCHFLQLLRKFTEEKTKKTGTAKFGVKELI